MALLMLTPSQAFAQCVTVSDNSQYVCDEDQVDDTSLIYSYTIVGESSVVNSYYNDTAFYVADRTAGSTIHIHNEGTVNGSIITESSENNIFNSGLITGNVNAGDRQNYENSSSLITNAGTIRGALTLSSYHNRVTNEANSTIGSVSALGSGRNSVTNYGNIIGDVNLNGAENFFQNSGVIGGWVTVSHVPSTDASVFNRTEIYNGGVINGNVTLGASSDVFWSQDTARVLGSIDLGDGDDQIDLHGFNSATQGVRGGAGRDTLFVDLEYHDIAVDQNFFDRTSDFENISLNYSPTSRFVDVSGSSNIDTLSVNDVNVRINRGARFTTSGSTSFSGSYGNENITNAGSIAGGISLAEGNDTLINSGTIEGYVSMGDGDDFGQNTGVIMLAYDMDDGDDFLTYGQGGVFMAEVRGGLGNDTLNLSFGGTLDAPNELALDRFSGFETTLYETGVTALSGQYASGVIDVNGGTFFGRQGSVLTADTINVAQGASFGSAGVVNANVNVAGTLASGASPGIMTINGNLSLGSGSNTVFELTPTISDQLLVSGTVNIAPNATLVLSGIRPLTPGAALDLIVANGGLNGDFATINQDPSIQGFLLRRADRLQLLGQFAVPNGTNQQTASAINYVNSLLLSGQASPALLSAVPSLLPSNGGSAITAFAQIQPEAYASASQIGTENGLSIAKSLRGNFALMQTNDPQVFSFAQGMGDWRKLQGSSGLGVSKASLNNNGLMTGLGYGSSTSSISAFAGYLDNTQKIADLSAETEANGIFYGVNAQASKGGLDAAVTVSYDRSKAKTSRSLSIADTAIGRYRMRSLMTDVSLGYRFAAGRNWAINPHTGLTYISTKRSSVNETGGGAFALRVDEHRYRAKFVDAGINIMGGQKESSTFKPVLGFGLRHQLQVSGLRSASAGFEGATSRFSARGAGRAQTLFKGNAGFNYLLGKKLLIFTRYEGEYGKETNGTHVNAGIKVGF